MFILSQLLPKLRALEFHCRNTTVYLKLSHASVRHAELEQEDHWHYTVDRKRLFDAPFSKKYITSMSGMLFLLFMQSLFQFGAKEGK